MASKRTAFRSVSAGWSPFVARVINGKDAQVDEAGTGTTGVVALIDKNPDYATFARNYSTHHLRKRPRNARHRATE